MNRYQTIQITREEESIIVITFNRPERKNAWNSAMYAECAEVLEMVGEQDDVLAVVLYGGDCDYFSSGADLDEAISMSDDITIDEFSTQKLAVFRFMKALLHCPKLVVSAVSGHAIGIGVTILTHCDLVFVRGGDTMMYVPFFELSLVPEYCSSLVFPELMGQARANDMLLLGKRVLAEEALSLGLVSRVLGATSPSAFLQSVLLLLSPVVHMANAAKSLQIFKSLMRGSRKQVLHERMLEELDILDERFRQGEPLTAMMDIMTKKKRSKL